jgi:hypothetical protein
MAGHQQIGRKISGIFRAGRNVYGLLRVIRPYEVPPETGGPHITVFPISLDLCHFQKKNSAKISKCCTL